MTSRFLTFKYLQVYEATIFWPTFGTFIIALWNNIDIILECEMDLVYAPHGDFKNLANFHSTLSEMDAEEAPQVPAQKKAPAKRAAAKKKTSEPLEDIVELDDDDDDDFEVEATKGAGKKGAKKPAAKPKGAATAATKRRGPAGGSKKQGQVLGQKLLTDMLKPAENSGISPEKKVRKMRESPFNKKSGSILGRAVGKDIEEEDEEAEEASMSVSVSEDKSSSSSPTSETTDEVVAVAPRARPLRANRNQARYVVSDSESEKASDDSDFAEVDED